MGMGGEMLSAEQTLNMSPMDLFDSIFWGEYLPAGLRYHRSLLSVEPYPTGMEQVGFDYGQQQQPLYQAF